MLTQARDKWVRPYSHRGHPKPLKPTPYTLNLVKPEGYISSEVGLPPGLSKEALSYTLNNLNP